MSGHRTDDVTLKDDPIFGGGGPLIFNYKTGKGSSSMRVKVGGSKGGLGLLIGASCEAPDVQDYGADVINTNTVQGTDRGKFVNHTQADNYGTYSIYVSDTYKGKILPGTYY